ncbi:MAG TPA: RNA polymerase sigma factor [Gemmatimonadales bacterium]|jgi:RNA polymerase sigma-70 factor (ECF subfamily)
MTPAGDSHPRPKLAVATAVQAGLRERLLARDETALAELVDLASPWLLGVTESILRDRSEAEEVVFDVFDTAWQKIGEVEPERGGLMPWLLRVARNRAIDRLRRRNRRLRTIDSARASGVLGDDITAPPDVNEAGTPGWHVHAQVHAALAALPDEQRAPVRLAYFHGLTHSEIARELSIPMGTVKTRLRLAFDRLRPALASLKDWVQ